MRERLDKRVDRQKSGKGQVVESICLASNELWDIETKSNVQLSMQYLLRIKKNTAWIEILNSLLCMSLLVGI